jgi:transposase
VKIATTLRARHAQISYVGEVGTSSTSSMGERDDIDALKQLVAAKDARIAILEEQLRLAALKAYAPKSEKLASLAQFDLFNEAEALGAKPDGDAQASEIAVPAHTRERGKRKPIDATLPRQRIEHDIPDAQKTCACGCQLTRIGEVTSEQFDLVPARAQVLCHVRFKYACRSCGGSSHDGKAVVTAPLPAQPIPKSNASPGLLAHISTSKFVDGMPLYRQEGILARYKISVSRTAMACWMIKLGELVVPLINLMHETQLAYDILQMDETSVQVLKEDGRPATAKSYMWVRRGGPPGQRIILFDYAASRAGAIPMRLLEDYKGYLQSDAYAGYNKPGRRDGVKHVGCLDHARRKFVEAVKAQHAVACGERGLAPQALLIVRKIYALEKLARDANMTADERHRLRNEKARPLWDELSAWLAGNRHATPPQSLTGKAISYLADEWPRLIRYLDDGRIEVSNVLCENAIRPFVIGRKAWMFSDTLAGAHASARLYSIVETAKACGLEPYRYLRRIFEKLPQAVTLADVEALLPWNVRAALTNPTQ